MHDRPFSGVEPGHHRLYIVEIQIRHQLVPGGHGVILYLLLHRLVLIRILLLLLNLLHSLLVLVFHLALLLHSLLLELDLILHNVAVLINFFPLTRFFIS